ncbi:MAG: outer membrane beta-barrel protein [Dyadobacter sp.]|uniref:outer membrane beta-barrel protein n=1 Tax=Dyadobacter sp. TaxID=1914288 RepID=UPI0032643090
MSEKAPFDRKTLDGLKNYNIPYQEGSWDHFEIFRKKKDDRKRLIFFFYKIAAMLFLALAVGWGVNKLVVDHSKTTVAGKHLPESKSIKTAEHSQSDSIQNPANFSVASAPKSELASRNLTVIPENKKSSVGINGSHQVSDLTDQKFSDYSNTETGVVADQDLSYRQNSDYESLIAKQFTYLAVQIPKPFIPFRTNDLPEEAPNHSSRLGYSMVLNQNVNRATSSLPGYSFGLGGLADIPLSKKIDLSTGLSFGQQSLRIQKEKVAFSQAQSGIPHLDQVDYRWLHAEIPLNVRYRMLPARKWNIYVSGGLSALGTFGQKFDYTYSNSRVLTTVTYLENGSPIVKTQTLEETSVVRDDRVRDKFGFGSTINFALGFDYPWNATNLSVEPFVKYPIGTLTSENLQFLSLGIQLRWSIVSSGNFKK